MGGTWGAFLLMMVGFTSAQQFFTINSGLCTVDPAATNCIRSPYFGTSSYGNGQTCTITPTSLAIGSRMTATTFSTEASYDILRLRNTAGAQVAFSGIGLVFGPSNFVLGTGTIQWVSDGLYSTYAGWRVCSLPPAPPPAPGLCTNTCIYAADGDCDDGGPGAEFAACAYGTNCVDCGVRAFHPPPPPPGLCTNTCIYAADGDCDDGGPGAEFAACAYGTNCFDCGVRAFRPPPPPLASPPPPPPPPPYATPPPPHFTIISGNCTTDGNAIRV
jgi:hypothetical protein